MKRFDLTPEESFALRQALRLWRMKCLARHRRVIFKAQLYYDFWLQPDWRDR